LRDIHEKGYEEVKGRIGRERLGPHWGTIGEDLTLNHLKVMTCWPRPFSRQVVGFTYYTLQAFVKAHVSENDYPLTRMPHVSQIETLVSYVFEPGKYSFKELRNGVRQRTPIGRTKVEIGMVPLGIEVNNVVVR
jgi:hypothetical protein